MDLEELLQLHEMEITTKTMNKELADDISYYLLYKIKTCNMEDDIVKDVLFQIYGYIVLKDEFENTGLYSLNYSIKRLINIKKYSPIIWELLTSNFDSYNESEYKHVWSNYIENKLNISIDNLIDYDYIYNLIGSRDEYMTKM